MVRFLVWLALLLGTVGVAAGGFPGKGFVVRLSDVQSPQYRELARELESTRLLQDLAQELNQLFVLPTRVGLRYAECEESNAYYDPETRVVSVCLELIEEFYETLGEAYETEDEVDEAVAGAFLFIFFHEIGHALVDVYELPITGREEDAVDQLSAWMLVDGDEGDQAVLDAALSFYSAEESEELIDEGHFADEHSLNTQRFYNMVCWVYGSDPEGYAYLIEDGELPEARAERCESEYAQLDRSWTRLLKDHVRSE